MNIQKLIDDAAHAEKMIAEHDQEYPSADAPPESGAVSLVAAASTGSLLPCPFCGSGAELLRLEDIEYNEDLCSHAYPWYVECKKCSAAMPHYQNARDVIADWNNRSTANSVINRNSVQD